ncbi:hypothetical protein ACFQXA_06220 [Nocardiopsis composta]
MGLLDDEQGCADVGGEQFVELGFGDGVQVGAAADGGVVDDDVDAGAGGVGGDAPVVGGP